MSEWGGAESVSLAALVPPPWSKAPIILSTFAPRRESPRYTRAAAFSFLTHAFAIGAALWLGREVVVHRADPVAVLFRRRPPPPLSRKPEPPQELKKGGGRGVSLPRAVAPDIQPELELSFASTPQVEQAGPTRAWIGSGIGTLSGAGWADGLASGTVIRRSLARDPQELSTSWECDFPKDVREGKVVVRIRVHVSASGEPTRVTVVRPGPAPFNESAVECAWRQGFRPALDVNGLRCEGDRELSILFYRMGSDELLHAAGAFTAPTEPDRPMKQGEGSPPPISG